MAAEYVGERVGEEVAARLGRHAVIKMALVGLAQMAGVSLKELAKFAQTVADVAEETRGESLKMRGP